VRVLDREGRRVGAVAGTRGANSVALAPELGIGICSSGRTSTVHLFNLTSLVVEKDLRTTGGNPEAVVFDPAQRRIFAFNERGRNATAFDAFGGAVAGSIALGGRPGAAVADGRGHLFASLKDTREVLVLDCWKLTVLRRVPVPVMEEPSGLALDPVRNRLFVVGANRLMAILDSGTWKLLGILPIGAEPGGAVCDPATGGTYISHRDGSITVVRPDAAGEYQVASIPAHQGC
jgi:DNA-binding beta-propeller fold protein YncE